MIITFVDNEVKNTKQCRNERISYFVHQCLYYVSSYKKLHSINTGSEYRVTVLSLRLLLHYNIKLLLNLWSVYKQNEYDQRNIYP